jgi:hypothetical protein
VKEEARLARSRVSAFARTSQEKVEVAKAMGDPATRGALKMVVKPPSIAKSLRNVGAVLLISPDPFSGVPGAALLGASYVMKRREAANIQTLAGEMSRTLRTIRDLQSLL